MAVAERAAAAYAGNGKLAALAVAGSVGAGLADEFSDLELDCCWSSPPSDADRTGPISALGGELTDFWDYDQGDREWGENYLLGGLGVTVSNFTTGTVEQFLDDVVRRADTDPVEHMRLAALQRSRPLLGGDLITSWRARADRFPDELATALVRQALAERYSPAGQPGTRKTRHCWPRRAPAPTSAGSGGPWPNAASRSTPPLPARDCNSLTEPARHPHDVPAAGLTAADGATEI